MADDFNSMQAQLGLTGQSGNTNPMGIPTPAPPPVPMVVWHDLLVGFAYIVVGVGLWRLNRWAAKGAAYIAAVTVVIYAAFGFSVMIGRPYDPGTALAMALRFTFWTGVAVACFRWIARHEPLAPRE